MFIFKVTSRTYWRITISAAASASVGVFSLAISFLAVIEIWQKLFMARTPLKLPSYLLWECCADHVITSATTSTADGLFSSLHSMAVIAGLWGKLLIACTLLFMFLTFLFSLLCLFFFHFCFSDIMKKHIIINPTAASVTKHHVNIPICSGFTLNFSIKTKKYNINIYRW